MERKLRLGSRNEKAKANPIKLVSDSDDSEAEFVPDKEDKISSSSSHPSDQEEEQQEDDSAEEYSVEAIRDLRIKDGQRQYLVKWTGFDESENTWEPVSHFESDSAKKLVQKFVKNFANKKTVPSKDVKEAPQVMKLKPSKKPEQITVIEPTPTKTVTSEQHKKKPVCAGAGASKGKVAEAISSVNVSKSKDKRENKPILVSQTTSVQKSKHGKISDLAEGKEMGMCVKKVKKCVDEDEQELQKLDSIITQMIEFRDFKANKAKQMKK